jgi:predicted nucleic acid-binding protein
MIVVDASALTELLLQTELGERVERRVLIDEDVHAPHLLDVEVVNALRRLVRTGELTVDRAEDAIEDLRLLLLARHGHEDLLRRAWELRDHVTAYDGVYVALAEALDAPLVTCDRTLGAANRGAARIEVIAD